MLQECQESYQGQLLLTCQPAGEGYLEEVLPASLAELREGYVCWGGEDGGRERVTWCREEEESQNG